MKKKYALGADIGGSHISTILVDMENGRMVAQSQAGQKIDNQASADEILNNWAAAIRKTMGYAVNGELTGLGFAMPGPFDYQAGVALMKDVAKYESLYGINVGDELKRILDLPTTMPFHYLNDAMLFAIGEYWIGKASVFKNVVAITLGTGFGSAFLTDGVPIIEGERVPPMGYVYNIPYKNGMADDYFSTRWFVAEYALRSGVTCKGVKEIATLAVTETGAKKLFEEFGHDLGVFMAPLLNTFKAECIVIGGNISGAYALFGQAFEKELKGQNAEVTIVISELMESAAMVGSARLLDEEFWKKVEPLTLKI